MELKEINIALQACKGQLHGIQYMIVGGFHIQLHSCLGNSNGGKLGFPL